jgi:hypothetical protein
VITDDLRALADRADRVEGHRATRIVEVHQRIGVARRRRRTVAASGAVTLAAIAVATAIMFRPSAENTAPAPDPTPTPSIPTPVVTSLDRPLTYAVGRTIHYGDRVVDTGRQIAQVDVTDAGVVYLTEDGELWFTDGSKLRLIEKGRGTYDEGLEVVTAATGSRVAWLRSKGTMPVEVVVYDVASRKVVFTAPAGQAAWPDFDTSQPESQVQVLTADQVIAYYSDTHYNGRDIGQVRYVSYDLRTGRRTELSYDEFEAVTASVPTRALEWRSRDGDRDSLLRGSTDAYRIRDGVLTVDVFDDSVGTWRVADPVDPVSRDRLRIQVPAVLADGSELRLFQWLDDGVFAMVRMVTGTSLDVGDLVVVCTVSDSSCEVAVEGRQTFVLPGREFYE